jgi:tetratricopeptide (TPR) repeat protein
LNVAGREAEAERYLDAAIKADPTNGKARRFKGIALAMRSGEAAKDSDPTPRRTLLENARSQLLAALRFGDEASSVHDLLATIYEQLGDDINAAKHQARACDLDEVSPSCMQEANRRADAGDVEAARSILQRLRRAAPGKAELWLQAGDLWYKIGYVAEAKNAYEQALKGDPRSSHGHGNLAFVLFDLENYAAALEHFDHALAIGGDDSDLLAGRGIALAALGRSEEASQSFGAAAARDPSYLDCEVLRKRNMWSQAACQAARPLIATIQR